MPEGRYLQRVLLLGQVPRRKLKVSHAVEAAALWTGAWLPPEAGSCRGGVGATCLLPALHLTAVVAGSSPPPMGFHGPAPH